MTVTIGLPFSAQPLEQLVAAVRSVFAQTDPDWMLLLVADGAPAATLAAMREIEDPRVEVVDGGEQRGLAPRLNEIATRTRTSLLFRMDADDVMHPDRVLIQRAALMEGAADVVGTRAFVIDQHTHLRGSFVEPPLPDRPDGYLRSNAFTHPTVAGRTEWFRSHRYDEALTRSQDKALWMTAQADSAFLKLDGRLLFYRIDDRLDPRKQAVSSHFDRQLLLRYGPSLFGRRAVWRAVMRSRLKQAAFALASVGGQSAHLFQRKLEPLRPQEHGRSVEALIRSVSAAVPGWAPAQTGASEVSR
jgi:glycosyltransferase involved in cell wall biosynthesis